MRGLNGEISSLEEALLLLECLIGVRLIDLAVPLLVPCLMGLAVKADTGWPDRSKDCNSNKGRWTLSL